MRPFLRTWFLLALLSALGAVALVPACLAQAVAVAQISGVVSDATGAVIPGAQVIATETDKHLVREVVSDASGRFALPNLPVGPYRLDVTAAGFKTFSQTGLVLQVGNNVTINVSMQLGSVSEHLEVTAAGTMVETRENAVSSVIDGARITDLPLNGRQATDLVLLGGAALVTPGGGMVGSKNYFSSTTISVAGGQANGVNYLLDGGDHNDSMTNVNMPLPFPDALQEFSIQTGVLPARFGLHPGAVVNTVTKSGSNDWHGDLFEFLRNGDFNARNTFGVRHDSLKRNQFGGDFGGHIIRDKLFFFGGTQITRNRSDPPQTISYVSTPAVLGGDFSAIDGAGCVAAGARTLKDPTTGLAFPGNRIPVSRFSPQAVGIVSKYIPQSNDPCGKITYGIPTTGDEEQIIGRIDYVQNTKHSLYGRYFLAQYKNPPVFDGTNLLTTTAAGNWERAQTITLGDTFSFSGTTLNSFHATFSRRRDNRSAAPNDISPHDVGLNVFDPLPHFLQLGVTNYWSVGCGTCAAGHFNTNSWHFADDVDVIRGRHQMSFGVDFLKDQFNFVNGWIENGSWTFAAFTGDTGDNLANYMLGLPSDFTQSYILQMATRAPVFGLYAQDGIRLTAHLNINAGIRWEPSFAAYDYFGHGTSFSMAGFNAGKISQTYTSGPPGLAVYPDPGIPKAYFNDNLGLFSPRLGLVWDPGGNGKQTIRASAGIIRDMAELFYSERLTTNAPWGDQIDIPTPPSFANPYQNYPGGSPFPMAYPPPKDFAFAPASVFVNMPLNTKPTYTGKWTISYQRQLTENWMTSLTYLGNKTTHVWVGEDINPAMYIPGTCGGKPCSSTSNTNQRRLLYLQNPVAGAAYSSIVQSDQGANSHYNGLLFSVQHRMAKSFTLNFNYTYSHCISDGDFGGELAGNYYQNPYDRAVDRGSCNFDVHHLVNVSAIGKSPFSGSNWKGRLLGGWQLSPSITARSGMAINITSGKDNSLSGIGLDRPDMVLSNAYLSDGNPRNFFNPAAFVQNATGTFGNLGRDAVYGPGTIGINAALTRTFRLTERWRLEARWEAFNAINHVNYSNPATNLSSSTFGKITGAADPRIQQLSMKMHF